MSDPPTRYEFYIRRVSDFLDRGRIVVFVKMASAFRVRVWHWSPFYWYDKLRKDQQLARCLHLPGARQTLNREDETLGFSSYQIRSYGVKTPNEPRRLETNDEI